MNSFASALKGLMESRKLSASDVARALWGTTVTSRGYVVAKGRDRIGHYLYGTSFPNKETMTKLAKLFGVPLAALEAHRGAPKIMPKGASKNSVVIPRMRVSHAAARLIMNVLDQDEFGLLPLSNSPRTMGGADGKHR